MAEKENKKTRKKYKKRIPILRSSLGLHQMKTKSGGAARAVAAAGAVASLTNKVRNATNKK